MTERKGRDYHIENYLAAGDLMHGQDILLQDNVRFTKSQEANIDGFIDYLGVEFKSHREIYSDKIKLSKEQDLGKGPVGIFDYYSYPVQFDLLDHNGDIIISRDTEALELVIPKIHFTPDAPQVTFPIATRSLELIATLFDTQSIKNYPPTHVFGLTSPTIARVAKRWGFEVSSQPFPSEIYALIDASAQMDLVEGSIDLALLKDQHMVYQSTDQFINRFAKG